ncbi:RnfABCDGE type electron transport complex subunit G [Bacteroidales bacterium OttesenSCG-928-L03]|nr:RnfABCDGE type electron transport complex subunit G [Bacteroidales bacterium OttesenSCG-928-L03]
MFLSLTIISVVAGAVLASVNEVTKEPIALAKKAKLEDSIRAVVPEFDNSPSEEMFKVELASGDSIAIYPAKQGAALVGAAIETNTMDGFSGEIRILTGLTPEGLIYNYAILAHAETPGLGSKMDPWFKTDKNNQSILGKDLSKGVLALSKDGGEVDAITASTITSRAFMQAVNKAYSAFQLGIQGEEATENAPVDGQSDATSGATN